MKKAISGFSKLSKKEKLKWIVETFFKDPEKVLTELKSYWMKDHDAQKILDQFSENTISNFHLPYGVAPNFLINGNTYCVPMVIEESSVVAAASKSAKYWLTRGGFHAEVVSTLKVGQVHFTWKGDIQLLRKRFTELKSRLLSSVEELTARMEARGGGIRGMELVDLSDLEPDTYQLRVLFDTVDSMGANFINSVLEAFAKELILFSREDQVLKESGDHLEVLMSILSNYTPQCLVKAWVTCPIDDLGTFEAFDAYQLAQRFHHAVRIAQIDPYRATTHNKGIFNGIDAVVLATANDFRAVEANGHAYAAKDGQYRSLTHCSIDDGIFKFWIEIPLALGTVGGLTKLHPMARRSLELLGNPSAKELMMIVASMGLAQNFAAVKSLVTTGIQKGHMRMHLSNILVQLGANEEECAAAQSHFEDRVVSFNAVRTFLDMLKSRPSVEKDQHLTI